MPDLVCYRSTCFNIPFASSPPSSYDKPHDAAAQQSPLLLRQGDTTLSEEPLDVDHLARLDGGVCRDACED